MPFDKRLIEADAWRAWSIGEGSFADVSMEKDFVPGQEHPILPKKGRLMISINRLFSR